MAIHPDPNEMIALFNEIRESFTTFYNEHTAANPKGAAQLRDLLEKLDVMELYICGDFMTLWKMEKGARRIAASKARVRKAVEFMTPDDTRGLTYFR